ncbi:hypothetical protein ACO0LG_01300 [Undibacterium sp. Ji42W]|uniref:hypothetical protein n=1 Tax=Undibacterium sp. Ji42W TaxID=3413039 RepID=UPI003BF3FF6F
MKTFISTVLGVFLCAATNLGICGSLTLTAKPGGEFLTDSWSLLISKPDVAMLSDYRLKNGVGKRLLQAAISRINQFIGDRYHAEVIAHTIFYESYRAGIDPELIFAIAEEATAFKVDFSSQYGNGLLALRDEQVKQFVEEPYPSISSLPYNVRLGCVLLRNQIDINHGDLFVALKHFAPPIRSAEYPDRVLIPLRAWSKILKK